MSDFVYHHHLLCGYELSRKSDEIHDTLHNTEIYHDVIDHVISRQIVECVSMEHIAEMAMYTREIHGRDVDILA
jgi:hypothetical protein